MNNSLVLRVSLIVLCTLAARLPAGDSKPPLYTNDFEKNTPGDLPSDIVPLGAGFAVKSADHNTFIEIPADPVDGYGILFGPDGQTYLSVGARIQATASGKRTPEFGVGLADTNGYRLIVMPAVHQIQILRGEDVKATAPFEWESGSWTVLRLQAHPGPEGKTIVEGKAWKQGQPEPKEFAVRYTDSEEAPKGRPSAWGSPYSGTPIRVDDLIVTEPVQ